MRHDIGGVVLFGGVREADGRVERLGGLVKERRLNVEVLQGILKRRVVGENRIARRPCDKQTPVAEVAHVRVIVYCAVVVENLRIAPGHAVADGVEDGAGIRVGTRRHVADENHQQFGVVDFGQAHLRVVGGAAL